MKKKITFILPSLCVGGAENNTVKLSNQMVDLGHDVYIITIFSPNQYKSELDDRVKVINLNCKRLSSSVKKLRPILIRLSPDGIFTNMWPLTFFTFLSIIWNKSLRKRTILVEHINIKVGLKNCTICERCLEYTFHLLVPQFVKGIIGVSPGVISSLRKNNKLSNRKYKVIPNPIFMKDSLSIQSIKNFKSYPKCLKILAVGNFKPQKDYLTMFLVLRRLEELNIDSKLLIAGGGELLKEYKGIAFNLGLNEKIEFLGVVKDLKKLYISSDLYLMTSAWEGFGNTIAEALSYGCRVVSTDCPSGPSYILGNGKYGTLANVGDIESVADAIIKEISIERTANQFAEAVQDFSIETVTSSYLEIVD